MPQLSSESWGGKGGIADRVEHANAASPLSVSISGDELERINAALPGSSLTAGGLVYVPNADQSGESFSSPVAGETTVLDAKVVGSHTSVTYSVGAPSGLSGGLVVLMPGSQVITFAPGTWLDSSTVRAGNGDMMAHVILTSAQGIALGPLAIDLVTGAATFGLADNEVLRFILSSSSATVSNQGVSSPAFQTLVGYLNALGDSITEAELAEMDNAYENPAGTPYIVRPASTVANRDDTGATVTYSVTAPSATVSGQPTATIYINGQPVTVPATNVIVNESNLSTDTIENIQILEVSGSVSLTADQLSGFSTVDGNGMLIVAGGGTATLAGGAEGTAINLSVSGWEGTMLTGSDQNSQTLTASLYGNDTLRAGSGVGDILIAGQGVDTLTGGTGGDTFVVNSNLAQGSTLDGSGVGNTLIVTGNSDLSLATMQGIQTLLNSTTILSLDEFDGLGTIENAYIDATTGGVWSLAGKTVSTVSIDASSNADTSIIGTGTAGAIPPTSLFLTASGTGNDTLTAGDGNQDTLSATGSGNDTLTVGNGSNDVLSADGSGNDTLTAGTGAGDDLFTRGGGNSTLIAGNGAGDQVGDGGAGDNVLRAGDGAGDVLYTNGTGNDKLIAGNGVGDGLSADGSGNDDLTAGNGNNDQLIAYSGSSGNDTLTAGSGQGDVLTASGSGQDTLSATGGSGDTYILSGNNVVDTVMGSTGGLTGATIESFLFPDQIDITDLSYGTSTTLSFAENSSGTGGTLTVANGMQTVMFLLTGAPLASVAPSGSFVATQGAGGKGTLVSLSFVPPEQPSPILAAWHH